MKAGSSSSRARGRLQSIAFAITKRPLPRTLALPEAGRGPNLNPRALQLNRQENPKPYKP